ncbi:hypothetical protein M3Y99_00175800 [Aphelenchoides fujianensis]|nr:hypothetical protein M3Y99_00175800 [Aphelenchoides fujianensis]
MLIVPKRDEAGRRSTRCDRGWKGGREGSCLLLTGPSGSGKSTTVRLLCDELDFDLSEWEAEDGERESKKWKPDGVKPASLDETIPFGLPTSFRDALPAMRVMTIFVLTTVHSNYQLIRFNPIPNGVMTAHLQKLIGRNGKKVVSQIVDSANGDLRAALSKVELYKKYDGRVNVNFFHTCDPFLDIFHFIGKLLYGKREKRTSQWTAKQKLLSLAVPRKHRRDEPPKDDPADLMRTCPLQFGTLVDYVMEHELGMYKNDLPRLSRVYSDVCEFVAAANTFELQMDPLVNDLGCERVIYSMQFNNYSVPTGGYRKLTKAPTRDMERQGRALREELNAVYPSGSFTDIVTTTLPMLAKVNSHLRVEEAQLLEKLYPEHGRIARQRTELPDTPRRQLQIAEYFK